MCDALHISSVDPDAAEGALKEIVDANRRRWQAVPFLPLVLRDQVATAPQLRPPRDEVDVKYRLS